MASVIPWMPYCCAVSQNTVQKLPLDCRTQVQLGERCTPSPTDSEERLRPAKSYRIFRRGQGARARGRGGGTQFVHGRVRMTIDRPSHPCYAGTEHIGFSPTRQTLLAPREKRREVFGESHEG